MQHNLNNNLSYNMLNCDFLCVKVLFGIAYLCVLSFAQAHAHLLQCDHLVYCDYSIKCKHRVKMSTILSQSRKHIPFQNSETEEDHHLSDAKQRHSEHPAVDHDSADQADFSRKSPDLTDHLEGSATAPHRFTTAAERLSAMARHRFSDPLMMPDPDLSEVKISEVEVAEETFGAVDVEAEGDPRLAPAVVVLEITEVVINSYKRK